MFTSGPSLIKENTHEIALLKEKMVEMMCMMQQLVVGKCWDFPSPAPEGFTPSLKMRPNYCQIQIKAKPHHHSSHKGVTKNWILPRIRP